MQMCILCSSFDGQVDISHMIMDISCHVMSFLVFCLNCPVLPPYFFAHALVLNRITSSETLENKLSGQLIHYFIGNRKGDTVCRYATLKKICGLV